MKTHGLKSWAMLGRMNMFVLLVWAMLLTKNLTDWSLSYMAEQYDKIMDSLVIIGGLSIMGLIILLAVNKLRKRK
jgi:uncharacterized integral membrane protein